MDHVMPKLNFEQPVSDKRDVGGLSSMTLLMLSLGTVLLWAVLIHAGP
jgi:hypothetical protein